MSKQKPSKHQEEPSFAPGFEPNELLQKEATEEDVNRGDYTEVSRLIVDHTLGEYEGN